MPDVSLAPEQQRFVDALVASGRFANASEVMAHALRMMQQAEEKRERFVKMLYEASEEADRDGTLSMEEVEREVTAVIEAARRGP